MRFHLLMVALATCSLGLNTACQSISDSVTSPSRWLADSSGAIGDSSGASADSSNAFSQSISGSSSPDDDAEVPDAESRYREDVRVAARAWGTSDAPADSFARELSQIAASHGFVDWQAQPSTWAAVAEGLQEAGVPATEADARLASLGVHSAYPTGAVEAAP
jgi:hypothetical protein